MNKSYTIAVIGLGLIGASICKRLKGHKLVGVSRSLITVEKALSSNIIEEGSTELSIIKDADIVFICTPINKIFEKIDEVRAIVRPDCLISDVASVKGAIMDYVDGLDGPLNFIGGHPMAGTEHKGIDFALDNLFDGAKWVLTPSKWTNAQEVQKLEKLIINLGAKPILADPYEHDKAVALISHLPLLLSQALFGFVSDYPDKNVGYLALKLAASGFRDTTRLAATNPELAKDMLIENKANVLEAVKSLKLYLSSLDSILEVNEDGFVELTKALAESRKNMYSETGINIL